MSRPKERDTTKRKRYREEEKREEERREATHTSGLDWDWKEGVKQSFQTAETLERAGKALLRHVGRRVRADDHAECSSQLESCSRYQLGELGGPRSNLPARFTPGGGGEVAFRSIQKGDRATCFD